MRPAQELTDNRRDAASRVAEIQLRYAQAGVGLAQAAMAGARVLEPLRHYPAADVCDAARGTRFFYHAHASHCRPADEHGHFHLFAYPAGRTSGPDFLHLGALSLDARGFPLRWFLTNRWVTGERWQPAAALIAALERFQVRTQGRLAPVAEWLSAMVRLYAPDLAVLARRRDRVLAGRIARLGADAVLDDRSLDVVAQQRLSLPERLLSLDRPTLSP